VRANHPRQHAPEVADDGVQIEDLRRQRLLAAVRKQLSRQVCRTLGRLDDLVRVATQPLVESARSAEEVAVAADREQKVVEVVGDPACELSDRFELLRLP
jgi:hypothetical protein